MSRSSTVGRWADAGDHVEELRRDLVAELLEGVDDLERRLLGRAPVADVADADPASPAGRLALGVHHPELLLALDVEDVLPGPAAVDAVDLRALAGGVGQHAGEGADEADLPAGSEADPDDDVVEALQASFLDVDVALEGARDGRREVAAGELLRALVGAHVPVGDIDRLVRHQGIVTPAAADVAIRSSIRISSRGAGGRCETFDRPSSNRARRASRSRPDDGPAAARSAAEHRGDLRRGVRAGPSVARRRGASPDDRPPRRRTEGRRRQGRAPRRGRGAGGRSARRLHLGRRRRPSPDGGRRRPGDVRLLRVEARGGRGDRRVRDSVDDAARDPVLRPDAGDGERPREAADRARCRRASGSSPWTPARSRRASWSSRPGPRWDTCRIWAGRASTRWMSCCGATSWRPASGG